LAQVAFCSGFDIWVPCYRTMPMVDDGKQRILLVLGSPQSQDMFDTSLFYSDEDTLPAKDTFYYMFAIVYPDKSWAFPKSLKQAMSNSESADQERFGLLEAIKKMKRMQPHVCQSHLMCKEGQTVYRGLLRNLDVPIMGSPLCTLVVGQDKGLQRQTLSKFMAPGMVVHTSSVQEQVAGWNVFPCVVKAADLDNSIGLSKVERATDLMPAVERCFAVGAGSVIVEEFVAGKEWRVCVLDLEDGRMIMTPVVDYMLEPHEVRGFEMKLKRNEAGRISSKPDNQKLFMIQLSDLAPAQRAAMEHMAFTTFHELGCRDIAVIDFRIDEQGQPWLLEVGLWCKLSKASFEAISVEADGRCRHEVFRTMVSNTMKRHEETPSSSDASSAEAA